MSVYVTGGAADLFAEFTVGDVLTDPTTVTLTVIDPSGNATTPVPTHPSTGRYEYVLPLDEPGTWRWEFVGTGTAAGVRAGSLVAEPGIADGMRATDLVTIDEIETVLGRALTADETDRAEQLVRQLVDTLEVRLNRYLYPRAVTETHWLRPGLIDTALPQRLQLWRGPVRSITSITVNGLAYTEPLALADWEGAAWQTQVPVVVTYVAGDDPRPGLSGLLSDIVARTLTAGTAAATGAIGSYSVEGTSITFGNVASGGVGGSGRLAVGDIRALGRLRRPVIVT